MPISITPAVVAAERQQLIEDAADIAKHINDTRVRLGTLFEESVEPVTTQRIEDEIAAVFACPDLAINITGYLRLLEEIDIESDYPGFIVDEVLGRHLAMTLADGEPEATLAGATFHLVDASIDHPGEQAGVDDRTAGIIAGFQVRLPGWAWQEHRDPFTDLH